ncbi:MAG: hypothetical protein IKL79_05255 [Clostridia bacterium]|nr:hypothetical protein [Clostridia bacterium]
MFKVTIIDLEDDNIKLKQFSRYFEPVLLSFHHRTRLIPYPSPTPPKGAQGEKIAKQSAK